MKNKAVEFEEFIKNMPRAELGGLLKEYIAESNHMEWDGFGKHHRAGMNAFFTDFMNYHNSLDLIEREDLGHIINNVNPVP